MIIGGVIGAQIGASIGTKLKAEYLRGILAIIVLIVCAKIFADLTLTPSNLFSFKIIMTKLIKKITIGLDILVLLLIFIYTAIYILKYENNFFSKIIIFSAIIAFIIKILYWIIDNNIIKNYKNLLLFKNSYICIFLYLTPVYYLTQYQNLIISEFVVTSTLIIITFFALLVIVVEKLINKKKMSDL